MSPHDVSTARQKKGIFGRVRAKTRRTALGERFATIAKGFGINAAGVSRTDQCYEPLCALLVAAIPERARNSRMALITTS